MSTAWLALNSARGLGPVRIKQLVEHFGSAERALSEAHSVLDRIDGMPRKWAAGFSRDEQLADAERQEKLAADLGVRILKLDHESYPALLREIFAPPPVLFVKGDLDVFSRHAVAIVGTRLPSDYGRKAADHLSSELAVAGVAVVSGLARGIDTVAHTTCLNAGVPSIAVFGCGIDRIYPAENKDLAARIAGCGALVSEFPPGTPPESFNFPRRNRIISGLSAGVVVVESGAKGGALITAHYALQQGREVFAVPGSIFSERSAGTHNLIRSGATPVRSAREILDAITIVPGPPAVRASTVPALPVFALELLSDGEREVYEALSEEPSRIDTLGEKTARQPADLLSILLNLELKGLVRQLAGNQYVRPAG